MPFSPTPKDMSVNWRQVLLPPNAVDAALLNDAVQHVIAANVNDGDNIFDDRARCAQAMRSLQLLVDFCDYNAQRAEEKCRRAVNENRRVADENAESERKLEIVASEADQAKSEVAALQEELRRTQREILAQQDQIRKEKDEAGLLYQERLLERKARENVEKDLVDMQRRQRVLVQELEDEREHGRRLARELQSAEKQTEGLDKVHDAHQALVRERSEVQRALDKVREDLEVALRERSVLEAQVSAQEETILQLKDKVDDAARERDMFSSECAQLEQQAHVDLETVQGLFKQMLEDEQMHSASLQTKLDHAEEKCDALRQEKDRTEAEAMTLRRERERIDSTIDEKDNFILELKEKLKRLHHSNDSLLKSVRASSGFPFRGTNNVSASMDNSRELAVYRDNIESLEKEVKALQLMLVSKDAEITSMKTSIAGSAREQDVFGTTTAAQKRQVRELRQLVAAQRRVMVACGVSSDQIKALERKVLTDVTLEILDGTPGTQTPQYMHSEDGHSHATRALPVLDVHQHTLQHGAADTVTREQIAEMIRSAVSDVISSMPQQPPLPQQHSVAVHHVEVPDDGTNQHRNNQNDDVSAAVPASSEPTPMVPPPTVEVRALEETVRQLQEMITRQSNAPSIIIRETVAPSGVVKTCIDAVVECALPITEKEHEHARAMEVQSSVEKSLRQRVVELEALVADASQEKDNVASEVRRVEAISTHVTTQRNELMRQLREKSEETDTLRVHIQQLTDVMANNASSQSERSLIEKVATLQTHNMRLSAKLRMMQLNHDQLRITHGAEDRARTLLDEIFTMMNECATVDNEEYGGGAGSKGAQHLPSHVEATESAVMEAVNDDVNSLGTECRELRAALQMKESEVIALKSEADAMRRKFLSDASTSERNQRVLQLECDLEAALQRAELFSKRVEGMDRERVQLEGTLHGCYAELSKLRGHVAQQAGKSTTSGDTPGNKDFESRMATLKSDLSLATRTNGLLMECIIEAQNAIEQHKAENGRLTTILELADIGSEDVYMLGQLHMELLQAQKEAKDASSRVEALTLRVSMERQEAERLRTQCRDMRKDVHSLLRDYAQHTQTASKHFHDAITRTRQCAVRWKEQASQKSRQLCEVMTELAAARSSSSTDAQHTAQGTAPGGTTDKKLHREVLELRERTAYLERLVQLRDEEIVALEDEVVTMSSESKKDTEGGKASHGMSGTAFFDRVEALCDTLNRALTPPSDLMERRPDPSEANGGGNNSEITRYIKQLESLELQVHDKATEISRLQQMKESLSSQVRSANEALARSEQTCEALRGQMKDLRERHTTETERLHSMYAQRLESNNRHAQENIHELQGILDGKNKAVQQLRDALSAERARNEAERKKDVVHMESLHARLAQKNEETLQKFQAQQRMAERMLAQPNSCDDTSTTELLRIEVAELKDRLHITEKQLQRATATSESLRAQLSHELSQRRAPPQVFDAQTQQQDATQDPSNSDVGRALSSACEAQTRTTLATTVIGIVSSSAPTGTQRVQPLVDAESQTDLGDHHYDRQLPSSLNLAHEIQSYHSIIDEYRAKESSLQGRIAQQSKLIAELQNKGHAVSQSWQQEKDELSLQHQAELSAKECKIIEIRGTAAALEERVAVLMKQLADSSEAHTQKVRESQDLTLRIQEMRTSLAAQESLATKSQRLHEVNRQLEGDMQSLQEQNKKLIAALDSIRRVNVSSSEEQAHAATAGSAEKELTERLKCVQQETSLNLSHMQRRLVHLGKELQEHLAREAQLQKIVDACAVEKRTAAREHAIELERRDDVIRDLKHKVSAMELLKDRDRTQAIMSPVPDSSQNQQSPAPPSASPRTADAATSQTCAVLPRAPLTSQRGMLFSFAPQSPSTLVPQSVDSLTGGVVLQRELRRMQIAYDKERNELKSALESVIAEKTRQIQKLQTSANANSNKATVKCAQLQKELAARTSELDTMASRVQQIEALHASELARLNEDKQRALKERDIVHREVLDETRKSAERLAEIKHRRDLKSLRAQTPITSATVRAYADREVQTARCPTVVYAEATAQTTAVSGTQETAAIITSSAFPQQQQEHVAENAPPAPKTVGGGVDVDMQTEERSPSRTRTVSIQTTDADGPFSMAKSSGAASMSQRGLEVQQWEATKRMKKEIDRLKSELAGATTKSAETKKLVDQVEALKKENMELKIKDVSAQQQRVEYASVMDVRAAKQEIMALEAENEKLQRTIKADKEIEAAALQRRVKVANEDVRRLENEISEFKIRETVGAPAPPPSWVDPIKALEERREFEEKVLGLEGTVLDLRVDREMLAMRARRLERHVHDLMVAMEQHESSGHKPPASSRRDRQVQDLKDVVENLKTVVTRLNSENEQLRTNTVPNSKYLDIVREVKSLKLQEKELRHELKILKENSSAAGGRPGGLNAADLMRKLKNAQDLAATYRSELETLRRRAAVHFVDPTQISDPPSSLM
eukprot:PhM_4_TR16786/c0_g1_i1/m.103514